MNERPEDNGENPSSDNNASSAGEEAVRDLALRLLSSQHINGARGYATSALEIIPGELPLVGDGASAVREMPLGLPMPEGSWVIGSLTSRDYYGPGYVILLSSAWYADDLIDWYDAQLQPQGWSIPEDGPFYQAPTGGFGGSRDTKRFYCKGTHGPSLTVSAAQLTGRATEIRLELDTSPSHWCNPDRTRGHRLQREKESVIPSLKAPRDSHAPHTSISVGGGSSEASITLITEFDLAWVMDHYAGQLQRAGWVRADGGLAGPVSWSNWTFNDKHGHGWAGTFIAMPQASDPATGKNRYFLGIYTYKTEARIA